MTLEFGCAEKIVVSANGAEYVFDEEPQTKISELLSKVQQTTSLPSAAGISIAFTDSDTSDT